MSMVHFNISYVTFHIYTHIFIIIHVYVYVHTYSVKDFEVEIVYSEVVQRAVCVDQKSSHDKEEGDVDPAIARGDEKIHWTVKKKKKTAK